MTPETAAAIDAAAQQIAEHAYRTRPLTTDQLERLRALLDRWRTPPARTAA